MAFSNDKTKEVKLSTYGDQENRQFSPWFSVSMLTFSYSMYLVSAMLPVLLPWFSVAVFLDWIDHKFLTGMICAIFLDFVIPLPDPLKPKPRVAAFFHRVYATYLLHRT